MQQKTKMVVKIGDRELVIGEATPAQVRILTKRDHGKLVDGKLHLNLRPIHHQVGERRKDSFYLDGKRDPHISHGEMDRRWKWFQEIMADVVEKDLVSVEDVPRDPRAVLNHILKSNPFAPGSKFPLAGPEHSERIPGPEGCYPTDEEGMSALMKAAAESEGEVTVNEEGSLIISVGDDSDDLTPYDVEMIEFFRDKLEEIWSSAPDVSGAFGSSGDTYYTGSVLQGEELAEFLREYDKEVREDPDSKVIKVSFNPTFRYHHIAG